jgi:hypothetical protein
MNIRFSEFADVQTQTACELGSSFFEQANSGRFHLKFWSLIHQMCRTQLPMQ